MVEIIKNRNKYENLFRDVLKPLIPKIPKWLNLESARFLKIVLSF